MTSSSVSFGPAVVVTSSSVSFRPAVVVSSNSISVGSSVFFVVVCSSSITTMEGISPTSTFSTLSVSFSTKVVASELGTVVTEAEVTVVSFSVSSSICFWVVTSFSMSVSILSSIVSVVMTTSVCSVTGPSLMPNSVVVSVGS